MQLGEVVELGRHRLMCGDAFNPEHVDLLMRGEKPAMLYCDPPYGMKAETTRNTGAKARGWNTGSTVPATFERHDFPSVIGDDKDFDPQPIITAFASVKEQFWWGADYYRSRLPEGGSWIAWDKRRGEAQDRAFGSVFELCWSRTPHKRDIARILWFGVCVESSSKVVDYRRHHPTQKPVALAEWFLTRYSKEDALVVDLFAGSGSTLLGCERTNRRCYSMELSPDYCNVIIDRYQRMTQQASLLTA